MTMLDLRPQVVDVYGYAGDTLEIAVIVPTHYINGRNFDAQVRPVVGSDTVSASFVVVPPEEVNGPALLQLPSDVTRALVESGGTRVRLRDGGVTFEVMRFTGVWDCQLSMAGLDPVRTIVKGALYIDMDITDLPSGE